MHEGLTVAEYDSMALTANDLGMPYGGHIPNEVGLKHALQAGQQTVDHLEGCLEFMGAMESPATEAQIRRAVNLSLETGVWTGFPTCSLIPIPKRLKSWPTTACATWRA
ncbi:MAG: hypothetical protein U5K31_13680 [Balneolaceae bacterium]|nr:hypothetical protein [Balneolaceae bacterium]